MQKKAFTIVEVILVVVIIGILATLGFPGYQNAVDQAKSKLCSANLEALQGALDLYALDHDTMPASLSQLPQGYIIAAYSRILRQKGAWKIRLAHFMVNRDMGSLAYAEPFIKTLVKGNTNLLICPKDRNPQEHGGISYGMNTVLANISSRDYKNLPADTFTIGDCNSPTFSNPGELVARHTLYRILGSTAYAQAAVKAPALAEPRRKKKVKRIRLANSGQIGGIDDAD